MIIATMPDKNRTITREFIILQIKKMSNFESSYSGFRRCTNSYYMYSSDLRKSLRYSDLTVFSRSEKGKIKVHNLKVCDFLGDRSE